MQFDNLLLRADQTKHLDFGGSLTFEVRGETCRVCGRKIRMTLCPKP